MYTRKSVGHSGDYGNVYIFVNIYSQDEPMNIYLQLGDCPELEYWATKYIKDGCSFKALNTKNEIIGVILNGIIHKTPQNDEDDIEEVKHEKFNTILSLFRYIDTIYNVFDVHPEYDMVMDAKIMSVNDAYRGVGIGKELTRRSVEWMKDNDVHVFHVMCTSHFSAKVCEATGFKVVFTLAFKDYKVNGVNPIIPAAPHEFVQCFTRIV